MNTSKAPDKIYLLTDETEGFVFTSKRTDNKGVEYIRKEAILEWLEKVKANPMIPMNIDKVIEHINSL